METLKHKKINCKQFWNKYLVLFYSAYGNLSVRSLLDTIEHFMKEFDFPDPYIEVSSEFVFVYGLLSSFHPLVVANIFWLSSSSFDRWRSRAQWLLFFFRL